VARNADGGSPAKSAAIGPRASDRLIESYGRGEPFDLVLLDWHMPGQDVDRIKSRLEPRDA
jgi:CheY-like chemotaxis protein